MSGRVYACIDLKSFYASVECKERGLDPMTTHLVVADAARTEKTICLAVTPSLKEYGISGRARLFEVVQQVKKANGERLQKAPERKFVGESYDAGVLAEHPEYQLTYVTAPPRMALYMKYSTQIYQVYLKYVAPEDIHVYSIDEVFLDLTGYLAAAGCSPRMFVKRMIQDVYQTTGITAAGGIGTNLYLAKVAMDIMAKHVPADEDGVRIAELDKREYRQQLWDHRPLTDFWRVGRGYAKKLEECGLLTMGDVARCSLGKENEYYNEDLLYKIFGVNAEILIDHAWGWEPCTIADIKAYKGPVTIDMYGRRIPKHAHGTANLDRQTSSTKQITEAVLELYDRIVDPTLLVRRLNLVANRVIPESQAVKKETFEQMDLFTDYSAEEERKQEEEAELAREKKMQEAMLSIKKKFGKNAILKGMNLQEGATARERNAQIGGHKA